MWRNLFLANDSQIIRPEVPEVPRGRSMVGYSRRGFLGLIAAGICAPLVAKEARYSSGAGAEAAAQYLPLMSVNWRTLVNDDLGIFSGMTDRLAIRSVEQLPILDTRNIVCSEGFGV